MEGENFQIIREMTGKNWQITKRGGWNKRRGWNIFMKSINVEGGFFLWNFSKSVSVGSTFIREMRVMSEVYYDECCSVKFVFSKKEN